MGLICGNCGCEKIISSEGTQKCALCKGTEIITYNEKYYGVMIQELKMKFRKIMILHNKKKKQKTQ